MRALLTRLTCTCVLGFACVADAATWTIERGTLTSVADGHSTQAPWVASARAIAGRSDGGAWVGGADGVRTITPDGRVGHVDLSASGLGEVRAIAVDPYDDDVWVATDAALLVRFSHDGALVQGTTLAAVASALAVDLDESVWVVAGTELLHFSSAGDSLPGAPGVLAAGEAPNALAVDGLRRRIWLATTHGVHRIANGIASVMLAGQGKALALDPRSGRVLAIVDETVMLLDADGNVHQVHDVPLRADDSVRALYDNAERAFLVEASSGTWRVDADGRVLAHDSHELAMHVAQPFRLDPAIELVRPPSGGIVSQATEEIVARVAARCNGDDCDLPEYVESMQVSAWLDATALPPTAAAATGYVRWPALLVSHEGGVHFTARVVDRFGHSALVDRAHWTFASPSTVDRPAEPSVGAPSVQEKALNKPPTVTLTSPAAGSSFSAGSAITLSATASDPDGSIVKVEFYRGGTTLLGTTTVAPYRLTWSTATAGSYSLTAKAYDNRGATATSPAVAVVVVDNQPPSVTLAAPASGTFVSRGSTVTLTAVASDADGSVARVQFLDGGNVVGTVSAPPFNLGWTASPAGKHTLVARAVDDKGASRDSAAVEVLVGEPPVVVVTSPVACSTVAGPLDLMLGADAASTTGRVVSVEFFDNGASVGTTGVSPWQVVLANAQRGAHSIVARATDDHGVMTASRPVEFTVTAPNSSPVVTLTSPANDSHGRVGAPVQLAASASDADGAIAAVEFRIGSATGALLGRTTTLPYAIAWTPSAAGTYSLVAVAFDDAGASTTSAAVRVIVDPNILPTVALTSPAAGAQFVAPATIVLAATASDGDGTVSRVDFLAGTTSIGFTTAAPYLATWSNVPAGTYSLTAKATDNAGGTTISLPVAVTVLSNAAPTVALTSPAAGQHLYAPATVTLSADALDADGSVSRVDFLANGTLIGSATAAPYRLIWDPVQAGNYGLVARATDDRGATSNSAVVNIVVSGPTLSLDGALSGATVDDDRVLVRGYVSAPANSAVTINGVVTHIDDSGQFLANDVPLAPGTNTVVAVVITQDGATFTQTIALDSTGPGRFVVHAAPTEGLESLQVTFIAENPSDLPFGTMYIDFSSDGDPDVLVNPSQFRDGQFSITATYPVGTWVATIVFLDDLGRPLYSTQKSIVVRQAQLLQANIRAIYDGMLTRLRAGNIPGAMTAFTGSAYEKYNDIFAQLQPTLSEIVDQLGTITEINFNEDMGELTLVRDTESGPQRFLIYLLRSEDGIWRIDGM